jgi:hypothetical protein
MTLARLPSQEVGMDLFLRVQGLRRVFDRLVYRLSL